MDKETTPIPSPKQFIISVSGDNISADVSVKTQDDFLALDGIIDTVKREVEMSNLPNPNK